MLFALIAVHRAFVRASIDDCDDENRFSVFSPSVRKTITLLRFVAGAAALESTPPAVSMFHPQTRPIVVLVFPLATRLSILLFRAVQSWESGISGTGLQSSLSAG